MEAKIQRGVLEVYYYYACSKKYRASAGSSVSPQGQVYLSMQDSSGSYAWQVT